MRVQRLPEAPTLPIPPIFFVPDTPVVGPVDSQAAIGKLPVFLAALTHSSPGRKRLARHLQRPLRGLLLSSLTFVLDVLGLCPELRT